MTAVRSHAELLAIARADTRRLVAVERDGRHAVVRLDDPGRLNALSAALTVQLLDRLEELARDPELRSVILTGSGPGFCAGGDLDLIHEAQQAIDAGEQGATLAWRWIRGQFGGVVRAIAGCDKVFIAAVNGPAAGVGLAFALACDLIVASERARLTLAFGPIGLIPEVGTSWLLTRRLGYQRSFELFVGGRALGGAEAAQLGLVNEVVAHEELMPAARRWVEHVEALPEHGPALAKPLLRAAADLSWEQALAMEEFAEPQCFTAPAHRAAMAALRAGRSQR